MFTVLPFLFQLQALRSLSAFTVNLAYNLEPVYSIAIAAILFGELREVNFSFWLGISLIIISVLVQTRRVTPPKSPNHETNALYTDPARECYFDRPS